MGFNTKGLTVFHKPWFAGNPQNAKKANATLTFTDVVSDGETATLGDNVYEFDNDSSVTEGNIAVDMTDYLPQASATLTFTGIPVAAETVTIGAGENIEIYEFVAVSEDVADPANIPVVLGETFTADAAVTALALEISSNSALVDAVASVGEDTVLLIAKVGGTGANTTAISTTCSNASFGVDVTTLSGGADTITAQSAAGSLLVAINTNADEILYSEISTGNPEALVIEYKLVGTEGNGISVATTCVNGSFGEDVDELSGGQFATPCNASSAVIVVDGTIYFTDKPCDKWTENAWYQVIPTLL